MPLVVNALKQRKLAANAELVFTNSIGGVISHNNFHTYVWKPLLRDCGIDYEFHSLRHAAPVCLLRRLVGRLNESKRSWGIARLP